MANCLVCGSEIRRGERYIGLRYKSDPLCSEECYNRYIKLKLAPKPPINYKPTPGSDRRAFTDLLQEWTDNRINWSAAMQQCKDLMDEFNLSWDDMRLVLKYAWKYEGVQWNPNYGLGQIYPRYIQPTFEFKQQCKDARERANEWEPTEEIHKVRKSTKRSKIFEGW